MNIQHQNVELIYYNENFSDKFSNFYQDKVIQALFDMISPFYEVEKDQNAWARLETRFFINSVIGQPQFDPLGYETLNQLSLANKQQVINGINYFYSKDFSEDLLNILKELEDNKNGEEAYKVLEIIKDLDPLVYINYTLRYHPSVYVSYPLEQHNEGEAISKLFFYLINRGLKDFEHYRLVEEEYSDSLIKFPHEGSPGIKKFNWNNFNKDDIELLFEDLNDFIIDNCSYWGIPHSDLAYGLTFDEPLTNVVI